MHIDNSKRKLSSSFVQALFIEADHENSLLYPFAFKLKKSLNTRLLIIFTNFMKFNVDDAELWTNKFHRTTFNKIVLLFRRYSQFMITKICYDFKNF